MLLGVVCLFQPQPRSPPTPCTAALLPALMAATPPPGLPISQSPSAGQGNSSAVLELTQP